MSALRTTLASLYHGDDEKALRFRLGLLTFDLITIAFFIASSFAEHNSVIYALDYLVGGVLTLDLLARLSLESSTRKAFKRLDTWLDLIVIGSLFASVLVDNMSFLRVIRMLRLLRSYHVLRDLRRHSRWFKAHQEIIESSLNLFIFIFFITACVFVLEQGVNPDIRTYLDALYFTVTTLTTTGFGDVTMKDPAGRLLSIIIMIVGVSLFLRLVQTIFRPAKVHYDCPDCGLQRHDTDAVHCKHCGRVLHIVNDGY